MEDSFTYGACLECKNCIEDKKLHSGYRCDACGGEIDEDLLTDKTPCGDFEWKEESQETKPTDNINCLNCEHCVPMSEANVRCTKHKMTIRKQVASYKSCWDFKRAETDMREPNNDIISQIGTPAALEQLAEECCELGQAALKLARKLRGENPTPKTLEDCTSAVQEEMADVLVCMGVLGETGMFGGIDHIDEIADEKQQRWQERLEHKE